MSELTKLHVTTTKGIFELQTKAIPEKVMRPGKMFALYLLKNKLSVMHHEGAKSVVVRPYYRRKIDGVLTVFCEEAVK